MSKKSKKFNKKKNFEEEDFNPEIDGDISLIIVSLLQDILTELKKSK
jgi:hypothetical protein